MAHYDLNLNPQILQSCLTRHDGLTYGTAGTYQLPLARILPIDAFLQGTLLAFGFEVADTL